MALRLLLAFIILALFVLVVQDVAAHHNGPKLPMAPNTALIQTTMDDGVVVWDVDSRAASYPGFISQMYEVNDQHYEAAGVPHRRAFPGEQPEILHTMPSTFPCDDAAGCIFYGSKLPVIVAYNYRLGYANWRTTQGHEGTNGGHAMGLHEQYDDLNGRCLTDRKWTVMSCGTGVWWLTDWDVQQLHSWLLPPPLRSRGMGYNAGGEYVYYCDGAKGIARHVAVLVSDPFGGYHFTGINMPIVGQGQCRGQHVISAPDYCFWLNQEHAFNYQRGDMRNDTLAGCSEAERGSTLSAIRDVFGLADERFSTPTCIAFRESGFRHFAVGSAGERGPFQIHPVHIGLIEAMGFTWDQMFEPWPNAYVAKALYEERGWWPWATAGICGA